MTDGDEWRIYNSHAPVPVEQKLFRVVHVSGPDAQAGQTLKLLAKAQITLDRGLGETARWLADGKILSAR